jgi:hypothetical protein
VASFTINSVPTLTFRMLNASIILCRFRYASLRISFFKKQVFKENDSRKCHFFNFTWFKVIEEPRKRPDGSANKQGT